MLIYANETELLHRLDMDHFNQFTIMAKLQELNFSILIDVADDHINNL